jgi:signal transduction histidine kinase
MTHLPPHARVWDLVEANQAEIDRTLAERVATIPTLSALARDSNPDDPKVRAAQQRSKALTRAALVDGSWGPYCSDLREQGRAFARRGVALTDWYELLTPYRSVLVPAAFATVPRDELAAVLLAIDEYVDRAMREIGQAYVDEALDLARSAEASLRRTVADLQRSNRDLDEFAYVASHDLRAPLRDIENLASWLVEDLGDTLPAGSARHLARLRDRISRMERLLEDLLQYSRAGRTTSQVHVVGLDKVLASAVALAGVPPAFRVEMEGPQLAIETPLAPLETILRNLVANAVKHHHRQEGLVRVGWTLDGDVVRISVADDGPGIPPEYAERVFEMFQTLKPRDAVEGSGMGLAVVRRIVEAHGGQISLDSPGDAPGTRIVFTWPARWNPEGK